ncbi:MAG: hypothetical protein ACTSU5_17345 [Promethearchaeota archaeon]
MAIFQSSDLQFQYEIVGEMVKDYKDFFTAKGTTTIYETPGKNVKNKTLFALKTILDYYNELKDRNELSPKKIPGSVWLWKFSNAGQGAEAATESIPNGVLWFLYLCVEMDLKNELISVLTMEPKVFSNNTRWFLKGRMARGEYYPFHRFVDRKTRKPIVPPNLAALYLLAVLGEEPEWIRRTLKLAKMLAGTRSPEDLAKLLKKKDSEITNSFQPEVLSSNNSGRLPSPCSRSGCWLHPSWGRPLFIRRLKVHLPRGNGNGY